MANDSTPYDAALAAERVARAEDNAATRTLILALDAFAAAKLGGDAVARDAARAAYLAASDKSNAARSARDAACAARDAEA